MSERKKSIFASSLIEVADEGYKEFSAGLIPTVDKERIIGVRMPKLRKLAKELWKAERNRCEEFLEDLPHFYLEEDNLHALFLCELKEEEKFISMAENFLPYIDNWATCDLFTPKIFKKRQRELEPWVKQQMDSEEIYAQRWGVRLLIAFYTEEYFSKKHLEWIVDLRTEEYYVNVARAWYLCDIIIKHYDQAVELLKSEKLDVWTHNKAIQKARESFRVDADKKQYLKTLKR